MSLPSKVTLGVAVVVSSAIIGYVHYKQSEDRLKLHSGVLRDVEQQQRRKNENTYALQQQLDIAKHLKELQPIDNRTSEFPPGQNPSPEEQQSQARLVEEAAVAQAEEAAQAPADGVPAVAPAEPAPAADENQETPPDTN